MPSSENPFSSPSPAPPAETPVVLGETTWPSVLGIIAIVFGVLGLMGGCGGAVYMMFMESFAQMMGSMNPGAPDTIGPMLQFKASFIGFSIVAMVLGGWLLTTGIGLMQRRPWSVRSAIVWSIAKMLFVVAQGLFNARIQQIQFAAAFEQQAIDPDVPFDVSSIGLGIAIVTMLIGVVWGWALPVFLLVWFRRSLVRMEVGGWKSKAEQRSASGPSSPSSSQSAGPVS